MSCDRPPFANGPLNVLSLYARTDVLAGYGSGAPVPSAAPLRYSLASLRFR